MIRVKCISLEQSRILISSYDFSRHTGERKCDSLKAVVGGLLVFRGT